MTDAERDLEKVKSGFKSPGCTCKPGFVSFMCDVHGEELAGFEIAFQNGESAAVETIKVMLCRRAVQAEIDYREAMKVLDKRRADSRREAGEELRQLLIEITTRFPAITPPATQKEKAQA